jgi:hypothetical protein
MNKLSIHADPRLNNYYEDITRVLENPVINSLSVKKWEKLVE